MRTYDGSLKCRMWLMFSWEHLWQSELDGVEEILSAHFLT